MANDVIEVLYRLRDMAGKSAGDLRSAIGEAQKVLDRLDAFSHDAEDVGQLAASSDIAPEYEACIPKRSGLSRTELCGERVHYCEVVGEHQPPCSCTQTMGHEGEHTNGEDE
jgi:hypothetical protein